MNEKSVLVHGTPSPLESIAVSEYWKGNLLHNNSGNVAFPYGIFRNLTSPTQEVISDWYGARLPPAEEVNERYSMYVMPMANDFGAHFSNEMKRLTAYIKKLKIPVVVVGIGGAFSENDCFDVPKPFDRTVQAFLDAVLDRSSLIGLRGAVSARYLESLGYTEGRHFEVIGDPTLFNVGRNLSIRPLDLTLKSKVAYNMTPTAPITALQFLNRLALEYENSLYIAQDIGDLTKLYSGVIDPQYSIQRETVAEFPNHLGDFQFSTGRAAMYLTAPSWISAMSQFDFSIGTRIHGNILATHAGTPTLTLTYGSRLRELTEYHDLPRVDATKLSYKTDLSELISSVDFHAPERVHQENFDRFVGFLDTNGIEHSYGEAGKDKGTYFDTLLAEVPPTAPVRPLSTCNDVEEMLRRVSEGVAIVNPKVVAQKQRVERLASEVRKLRTLRERLHRGDIGEQLNRIRESSAVLEHAIEDLGNE